jgi:hypothetical protein
MVEAFSQTGLCQFRFLLIDDERLHVQSEHVGQVAVQAAERAEE